VPEARFDDDLEIDSIDAVDLVDHLSRIFERRVSPRDFPVGADRE
jgi:acyl carrier protein